jgi:hypothetical protein
MKNLYVLIPVMVSFLIGCGGTKQDPLADLPDAIRNAQSPNEKPGGEKPTTSDAVRVDGPESFSFMEESYYNNGTIIKTHISPILPLKGTNTSSYTIYYNENCKKNNDVINCNRVSPIENIPVRGIYTLVFKDNKVIEDKFEPVEDWKINAKKRFDDVLKRKNDAEYNFIQAKNAFESAEKQYQKMKEELLAHKILSLNDLPYEKKEEKCTL